jgi:hypothetical protein
MTTVDEDEEDIPIWKPTPGDELTGVVVAMKLLDSKYGNKQPYPYLEIERKADRKRFGWHAAQVVAKSQLKQVRAQVGDELTIRYKGEHRNGYKDFVIKSDRNVEFDWNAVGADDGAE